LVVPLRGNALLRVSFAALVRVRRSYKTAVYGLIAAAAISSAAAQQYLYSPTSPDEVPGIRYFGSAKDDRGALLAGVSIHLVIKNLSYVLVTNEQGRYSVDLPVKMRAEDIAVKCFKAGYAVVRLNKRRGPTAAPIATVQTDCVLHAVNPR
jgi:hypothetical protein